MNTTTYLSQIKKYDFMIQNKNMEIERLRTLACNIVAPIDNEFVSHSGTSDKIGNMSVKIADISRDVEEIMNKRHTIISQIENIEDADMYNVLANIYILGKRVEDIADACDLSVETIRKLKRKAIKEFENKYKGLIVQNHCA